MVRFCLPRVLGVPVALLSVTALAILATSTLPVSAGPVPEPTENSATRTDADNVASPALRERANTTEPAEVLRVIYLKRGKDVYTRPRAKNRYHRGTAVRRSRFPVYEEKWGKDCKARWVRIGERAWICSVGTRPTNEQPDNRSLTALNDGKLLPKDYVVTRDATIFDSLNVTTNTAEENTLRGLGGFVKGKTRRKNGKRFVNTPRGWVPSSQIKTVEASTFKGVRLHADDRGKRLGFVRVKRARLYDESGKRTKKRGPKQQTYLGELDEPITRRGHMLYATETGEYLRARDISIIEWTSPPEELHAEAPSNPTSSRSSELTTANETPAISKASRWIDVSLSGQLLVAYEGERPVMATLVSTARTATKPGVYRIQKKRAYGRLRAKPEYNTQWDVHVPWVMTLDGRLAMHTVYWHDNFGKPFSQGCVNLAPIDAKWLWDWTEPHLPAGWVRVMSDDQAPGTVVRIRK